LFTSYFLTFSFLVHLTTKCSVSFCDPSMSGVHRPSSVRPCVRPCVNNFFKQHLLWNRLLDFDQTSQEWSLGGPLSKLFKPFQLIASIGHGVKKIGFQNAIFKNLLVRNYKAQSFYIWFIASCRCSLQKLFKLCTWGQNWPRPGGHNFTLIYIRRTSNNIILLFNR